MKTSHSHRHTSSLKMDRYGMALSIGCAVHCALLPSALTALGTAGMGWIASPELEWLVLVGTFLIGSTRLIQSYLQHRRLQCLGLFLLGLFAFTLAKAEVFAQENSEPILMVIGGVLVAAAHFRNARLASNCRLIGTA